MYHKAVLLKEAVDELIIGDEGWYVDVTMGGGGHTSEILKRLKKARVLAFDQDPDAIRQIPENKRLTFVPSNFRFLADWLEYLSVRKVSGVLADLGVSTFQIDEKSRGFTYRVDAELDMRMDKARKLSAVEVLNEYGAPELQGLLSKYGEIRNARTLAEAIVEARRYGGIYRVNDLVAIMEGLAVGKKARYFAQVFQAIRIEVNDEMGALRQMLEALPGVVEKGGRVVVLSYHSLEDRMVKNLFRKGYVEKGEDDPWSKGAERPFKEVNKKVIIPSPEEINENPRARSAKMRVGEKL